MGIFTKRKLMYGLLVLGIILVLLTLILLTTLAQMASINSELDRLQTLIDNAENDSDSAEELYEYMQSNEYICQWAEANGMILPEEFDWQS